MLTEINYRNIELYINEIDEPFKITGFKVDYYRSEPLWLSSNPFPFPMQATISGRDGKEKLYVNFEHSFLINCYSIDSGEDKFNIYINVPEEVEDILKQILI